MPDTLRSCIVSEPNYTFISLDASQIELRVLAILSQDPQMLEDLKAGDLHQATATRMFGWIEDEALRKKKRYDAKQCNFALVYDVGEGTLSDMFGCSIEEVEQFMAEHRRAYPTLYAWMDTKKAQVKIDGYVVNMFGRIRPLPELSTGGWRQRELAEKKIINTLSQGTAVDIVKLAMLYLRKILDPAVRLVLQVHDEILWECPNELLPQTLLQCQGLEQAFPLYPFSTKVARVYGELA